MFANRRFLYMTAFLQALALFVVKAKMKLMAASSSSLVFANVSIFNMQSSSCLIFSGQAVARTLSKPLAASRNSAGVA